MINTVLFDLDGTLADTARDLIATLNWLRVEEGLQPAPEAQVRPAVSHGSLAIIKAGMGINPDDPRMPDLQTRFLDHYVEHICDETVLFPGMDTVLEAIEARDMPWGVITNKPSRYTDPLMRELGLSDRAVCIISGDTAEQPKPHPAPMLMACELAQTTPEQCLYIGDAVRDVEAGNNVGMKTLAAAFGYLAADEDPDSWGADGVIQTPEEIQQWL